VKVYIQGLSALAHYRSSSARLEVERCPAHVRALISATSSRRDISDMSIWRLGIGEPSIEHPLEVLVPSGSSRSRSSAVVARVWSSPIAPTGLRRAARNIYVSSPEFLFLQMATRLKLPELVALGMELCGTYRRNVEVASVEANVTSHITTYHQPPLSTPKRLRGFLNSMKRAPGHTKALKALDYVLPNSASPMETALYLLLCLPRRLGGYALPKPTLNPPIVLSKAGRKHTLSNSAKPDLYWESVKLDLEFNSDEFHDESNRANDSMRRKALERMHVEVIELTTAELIDASLLHATVLRIALRLKKQLRPESEGSFAAKRSALREQLLPTLDSNDDAEMQYESTTNDEATDAETWAHDTDPYLDEETAWNQEALEDSWFDDAVADEDPWVDEFIDFDDTWDVDFDDTGEADVPDWDDDNLKVFGRINKKEESQ